MALVLCTLFIALTLVILGGLSVRLVAQARHVDQAEHATRALAAAEAAVALSVAALEDGSGGALRTAGVSDGEAGHGTPLVIPGMEDVRVHTVVLDWAPAAPDPRRYVVVRATASLQNLHRQVEVVLREESPGKLQQLAWRETIPRPGPPGST